jgi:hypothetical protein
MAGTPGDQPTGADEPALAPSERPGDAGLPRPPRAANGQDGSTQQAQPAEPVEPAPKLPRYLEVLERVDHKTPARVQVRLVPPAKLEIETDNVKRLRITRAELPLSRRRSTILRLDSQAIEWRLSSVAVEFERSRHGVWTVVKSRKSGR